MNIVEQATLVAVAAHKDQVRKSDGTPYIVHPLMVARMLDRAGFSDAVVAAGIVHDVLEDTPVTAAELRQKLGDEVVNIVMAVSEDKELDWETRKQKYIEQVVMASDAAKAVSVADKIHNAESLVDAHAVQGSVVWTTFNRPREQKLQFERLMLESLQAVWQHPLLDRYAALVVTLETLT